MNIHSHRKTFENQAARQRGTYFLTEGLESWQRNLDLGPYILGAHGSRASDFGFDYPLVRGGLQFESPRLSGTDFGSDYPLAREAYGPEAYNPARTILDLAK